MTRTALAKLSLLGTVAALVAVGTGCSRGVQLTSLALTPASATIEVGTTQAFSVAALFDDGTKAQITSGITWTSSNVSVASVSVAGVVTGVSAGSTTILASAQGLQASASVTITPLAVKSIAAAPATVTLAAGLTQQLSVTATMDDNSTQDVTAGSTYASSAASVATVSTGGKITAVAVGTATITVTASGKTATVAVTVTAATIVSLSVTPPNVSKIEGQTQQLTVSATYTNGDVKAPTTVTFTSADESKVKVSATGLVTAVAPAGANVTVTAGGKSVVVPVTVTAKTLLSIEATPATMTLPAGGSQQITVVGTYDNSATSTISTGIIFSSSAPAKATVSATGLVVGVAAGPATITVSAGNGINATVSVTVSTAVVSSISVLPASVALFPGQTQALSVTALYSDNSTSTISTGITWTTSDAAKATVSAAGVVTALAAGSASITAAVPGATKSITVTVNAQVLQSISTGSSALTVPIGGTSQLVVTGTYDVGPTQNVTASATYSHPTAALYTVSAGGLISGLTAGSDILTVTVGSKSTTVTVTIGASGYVFFHGAFDAGVNAALAGFGGSINTIAVDTNSANDYGGFHALRIDSPINNYTGGAWTAKAPRDLSAFNAITFYAKASVSAKWPVVGFGDDANGNSAFKTEMHDLQLTTTYQKFVLPLPDPAKATASSGLFYFADGVNYTVGGTTFSVWVADLQYEKITPAPGGAPVAAFVGAGKTLQQGATTSITSADLKITYSSALPASMPNPLNYVIAGPSWFNLTSSATGVATINNTTGVLSGVAGGTANLGGTLAGAAISNTLPVTVVAPLPGPAVAAPVPTATDVKSLWSSHYNGTAGDVGLSAGQFSEFAGSPNPDQGTTSVGGTTVRKYTFTEAGNYIGWGFHATPGQEVDAAAKGYDTMHVDIWSPDIATPVGNVLIIGVIDFGLNDAAHTEGLVTLVGGNDYNNSVVGGAKGGWITYDFPLSGFTGGQGLTATPHNIAQIKFVVPKGANMYVDNVYFYKKGTGGNGGAGPTAPPADPTAAAANVISLFSAKYTGGTAGGDYSANVGSYDASCFGGAPGSSTVADYTIPGTTHKVKQYTVSGNSFISIETIGATGGTTPGGDSAICNGGTQSGANRIDVSQMTGLHFDVWSSKAAVTFNGNVYTAATLPFNTGAGAISAPLPNKTFAANTWVPIDITLGDMSQITKMALLQLFSGEGGTIYLDNIYFYKGSSGGGATSPTTLAAAPTAAASDVVSLYTSSNKYTNISVANWFTGWGVGTYSTYPVPGTSGTVLKYAGLEYTGVDFANVDATATGVNTFHVDVFTGNGTQFGVKMVSGAGEFQVGFDNSKIVKGQWVSLDIPLSSFTGVQLSTLHELLFVDNLTAPPEHADFYVDNVYFYKAAGAAPTAPTTAPSRPNLSAGNVISLLSNAYTNVGVDTWRTGWSGGSDLTDVTIAGDAMKKYANISYFGVEFIGTCAAPPAAPGAGCNEIDATQMTAFHLDVWSPDATTIKVKLVDFGANRVFQGSPNDDSEAEVSLTTSTTPAMNKGQWVSLEIPISAFKTVNPNLNTANLSQMVVSGLNGTTLFLDNVYFHK
jgi:uncharacterized protein YjdB